MEAFNQLNFPKTRLLNFTGVFSLPRKKKKRRSFIPWPIKVLFWFLFICAAISLFVIPRLNDILEERPEGVPLEYVGVFRAADTFNRASLVVFFVTWFFSLGACFGSFLNVVAWRLPQGRSILGSSHCPFCNVKLPLKANIPVLGWLNSAGRCLTCKLPISIRYLWVEVVLGLIFLAVVSIELFCGGVNLPLRPTESNWGVRYQVYKGKLDLFQTVGFHLTAVCLIYVICLVRLERRVVPISIWIFGLMVGAGVQFFWPWVLQSSWPPGPWPIEFGSSRLYLTMFSGLIVGFFCGLLVWLGNLKREQFFGDVGPECVFGFTIIGLFFGFQFAITVCTAVLLFDAWLMVFGATQSKLFCSSPIFKIGTMMLIHLLMWRPLSSFEFIPGPFSSEIAIVIAICVTTLAGVGVSLIQPDEEKAAE